MTRKEIQALIIKCEETRDKYAEMGFSEQMYKIEVQIDDLKERLK